MQLPFTVSAARALGVSIQTLWRACSSRTRNPELVARYRRFVQEKVAELTGGAAAVAEDTTSPALPARRRRSGRSNRKARQEEKPC